MGNLLYTIAVILVIIWAIGFLGGYATGGLIHILLVIAIIAVILRIIQGRKPLEDFKIMFVWFAISVKFIPRLFQIWGYNC